MAAGRTSSEAFKKARKKCPEAKSEEIEISYIQPTDSLLILLENTFSKKYLMKQMEKAQSSRQEIVNA